MEQTRQFKLCKKFYDNQEAQQVEQQIRDSISNIPGVNCFRGKDNKIAVFFNLEHTPFYLKLLEQVFRKPNQQPPFQSNKQRLLSKNINKYYKRNQTVLQKCNVTNLSISSSSSSSSSSKKSKKSSLRNTEKIQEEEYKDTNQSEFSKQQQQQIKLYKHLVKFVQNLSVQQLTYSQLSSLLLEEDEKNSTDFAKLAFDEKQYVIEFLEQEIKDREVMLKFHQIQQGYCCGSLNNSQNNIITNSQDIPNSAFNKNPAVNNNNNHSFFEKQSNIPHKKQKFEQQQQQPQQQQIEIFNEFDQEEMLSMETILSQLITQLKDHQLIYRDLCNQHFQQQ